MSSARFGSFIKKLSHAFMPPNPYGLDNLRRLSLGKLPRSVTQWPLHRIDEDKGNIENRVVSVLLSKFDQQIIRDHPESSVAECKLVASMLLKCAEFANRLGDKSLAFPVSSQIWFSANGSFFSNRP